MSIRTDLRYANARLMREFHKIRYVLSTAIVAAIIAYLSVVEMPGWLAYGPLVPVFAFLGIAGAAPLGGWLVAAALFLPAYFLFSTILSLGLLLEYEHTWRVSAAMFVILTLGNCAYFAFIWGDAMNSQGPAYTGVVLLANVVAGIVTGLLLARSRRDQTNPWRSLAAHASVLVWLSWASFPWLGEWL